MSDPRHLGTRVYIGGMLLAALACCILASFHWQSSDPVKFFCYLGAAIAAAMFKVTLPGIEGTLSVFFILTLVGILEMSLPETLLIGLVSTLAQFYWKPTRQLKLVQLIFNLSQVTVSSAAAYGVYKFVSFYVLHGPGPLALLIAAISYFVCNTTAMSTIIGLTEDKPIQKVWRESYIWSFPYYMVGAAIAGIVSFLNAHIGWQGALVVVPPIYLMYRSYRLYLGKLEAEKLHAEEVSNLHLRTIEALALAIEAKDQTTGDHLQRVRVYAMELARELGLSEDEIEALRAASVLHDIGKLAVPEHIIAKPGKLTPEEFDKMKIHPIVGAEILEQVDFPYPVVPIVRAHHEKWDGSGYPAGLKREEIPIGARILAAVDCLDALASDRQYRRALPLDQAMAKVASESGTSFDPEVVDILLRRYVELEKLAREQPVRAPAKLSTDIKVERGAAPDAGFAESAPPSPAAVTITDHDQLIAAAQRELETLREVGKTIGGSLAREDMLALTAIRIRHFIAYDSIAIYMIQEKEKVLAPEFVGGQDCGLFSPLRIPLGEGLAGWVAQNSKAILNGNPSVEPGYLNDPAKDGSLRSALASPLYAGPSVVGVVALYRTKHNAFTRDELNLLHFFAENLTWAMERTPSQRVSSDPSTPASGASKARAGA
jgi:putative nucleotidyltransferase with HDIG domain